MPIETQETLLCLCFWVHTSIFAEYFFYGCFGRPFILFTKVSKISRMSKERTRTEITEVVYIPPLKLPNYSQTTPKLLRSKASLPFLQPVALDKNSDFLKEKSLYRFAISRKLNRFQDNKSSLNLSGGALCLQHSKAKDRECSIKREPSREASLLGKCEQMEDQRQRHFRRRNRNNLQKSYTQISTMPSILQEDQNEKVIHYLKTNKITLDDSNNHLFRESEKIQLLKWNHQNLIKENQDMKEIISNQNKQLQSYSEEIKQLKRENEILLTEIHRNISLHSQSFIQDHKIENQIRLRDTIIQQLESSIKYIKLENLTLKKAKTECNRQANLIVKLERENKVLQEKVKKLYKQKTKRRNMKGSLISECSDLSLNLSFEDEESQKRIEVLKTSQRTPQKVRNTQNYSGNSFENGPVKSLSQDSQIQSSK